MNHAFFVGNLGRDPELRALSNGDPVLNFPVGVDVGTPDNPKTMWVDCAVFGKRATALNQFLRVGTPVTVSGRVVLREFVNKDGITKQVLSLTCTDIDVHYARPGSDAERPAPAARRPAPATKARAGDVNDMDDDIPF